MKALLQRVTSSSVTVDGVVLGEVAQGYMILLGVKQGDTKAQADYLVKKVTELRVFTDENDKLNLSLLDIKGEALVISQFTLCADCKKGRRPSFISAEKPDEANSLYKYFCEKLTELGVSKVARGEFGADMKVSLTNDGPVTIMLDTEELMSK